MIKAYTLNKNGKIELTLEELQKLLEEAEEEGKRLAGQPCIVYREGSYRTPATIPPTWGDTPPFTSPLTCQTGTETENERKNTTTLHYRDIPNHRQIG